MCDSRDGVAATDPASASRGRLIANFAMSCAGGVQEVCREIKGQLRRKAVGKLARSRPAIARQNSLNITFD